MQPQVLCNISHLLAPVLYSLVSTTLRAKPGFFWHTFPRSLLKQYYTGQTLGILLFSSHHLCISFTGLSITVSVLLWIWWTVKLPSALLKKNRFGFFFFSATTSLNLKLSKLGFPQSKNKYIYIHIYLLFKLSKYVYVFV